MSGCLDLSLVMAALIWVLTGFKAEQVNKSCFNQHLFALASSEIEIKGLKFRTEIRNMQAIIWFCVFYMISYANASESV